MHLPPWPDQDDPLTASTLQIMFWAVTALVPPIWLTLVVLDSSLPLMWTSWQMPGHAMTILYMFSWFIWTLLVTRRTLPSSTGSGLLLSGLATITCSVVSLYLVTQMRSRGLIYEGRAPDLTFTLWIRDLSMFAFALGYTLTLGSSFQHLRQRRARA